MSRGVLPGLIGLGLADVLADLLYLLATREGFLSLVAVITSMYPAVTVLLAGTILRERMAGGRLFGFGLADDATRDAPGLTPSSGQLTVDVKQVVVDFVPGVHG